MLNGFHSQMQAKPLDMVAYRHLMGLVKADNHVAVARFLDDREDVVVLLTAKPFGCGLVEEAVSARMCGVLGAYLPDDERAGKGDPVSVMPNVHGAWAWHNAL